MALLKILKGKYDNLDAIPKLINYIFNPCKTYDDYVGGYGVVINDINQIAYQMYKVKEIYHKTDGRQARHFIVSFDEDISYEKAYEIGHIIARYYANKYQIVFAVHQDKENIHIHFVMNSVSYVDGSKYSEGSEDFYGLKKLVDVM